MPSRKSDFRLSLSPKMKESVSNWLINFLLRSLQRILLDRPIHFYFPTPFLGSPITTLGSRIVRVPFFTKIRDITQSSVQIWLAPNLTFFIEAVHFISQEMKTFRRHSLATTWHHIIQLWLFSS